MLKQHRGWFAVVAALIIVVLVGVQFSGTKTRAQEKKTRVVVPPTNVRWSAMGKLGPLPASVNVYRAEVPGGWLVYVRETKLDEQTIRSGNGAGKGVGVGLATGLTFVPDPEHKWK